MLQPYDDNQSNNNGNGNGNQNNRRFDSDLDRTNDNVSNAPPYNNNKMMSDDDDREAPLDDDLAQKRHRCIVAGIIFVALLAIAAIVLPIVLKEDCDCGSNTSLSAISFPPTPKPPTFPPFPIQTFPPSLPPVDGPTRPPTQRPSARPSASPSFSPTSNALRSFIDNLGADVSSEESFLDRSGPQYRAAEFMLTDSFGTTLPDVALLRERFALAIFYYAMNGDEWTSCSQGDLLCRGGARAWMDVENNHCSWGSVTCVNGFVTELFFGVTGGNNLDGEIPAEISTFTNLQVFGAVDDNVRGPLPASLGEMANLVRINFTGNNLSGTIPEGFWANSAATLQRIYLAGNNFFGSIPSSFGAFPELIELFLQDNEFDGTIPESLGTSPNLGRLNLANNNLSGALTSGAYNPNVENLNLSGNLGLRDTLSADIGNMQFLTILNLANTGIGGEIPAALFTLTGLVEINLEGCVFTGDIPAGFANLSFSLRRINLSDNGFSGEVPTVFNGLTVLNELQLEGNDLTGTVPSVLCERVGDGNNQIRVLTSDCLTELTCECCTECF